MGERERNCEKIWKGKTGERVTGLNEINGKMDKTRTIKCLFFLLTACSDQCKPRDKCRDTDKGLNVDVKFFQLTNIVIHHDVMERFMENLLLIEKNLREKHIQNATVIRKKTAGMVLFYNCLSDVSERFECNKSNKLIRLLLFNEREKLLGFLSLTVCYN